MADSTRKDFIEELKAMKERMEELFKCNFGAVAGEEEDRAQPEAAWMPSADIFDTEKEIVYILDLPGVPDDELQVECKADRLWVSGKRAEDMPVGAFGSNRAAPGCFFAYIRASVRGAEGRHTGRVQKRRAPHRGPQGTLFEQPQAKGARPPGRVGAEDGDGGRKAEVRMSGGPDTRYPGAKRKRLGRKRQFLLQPAVSAGTVFSRLLWHSSGSNLIP